MPIGSPAIFETGHWHSRSEMVLRPAELPLIYSAVQVRYGSEMLDVWASIL